MGRSQIQRSGNYRNTHAIAVGALAMLIAGGVISTIEQADAQGTGTASEASAAVCQPAADGHDHCHADAVNRAPGDEDALLARAAAEGIGVRRPSVSARVAVQADASVSGTVGQWGSVIEWPVVGVHMTLLPNGKVLAYDSINDQATETSNSHTYTRAMLFDPANNTIQRVDEQLGYNVFCSGLAKLLTGDVFFAGGNKNAALDGIAFTTEFNSTTNTWKKTANMAFERWYPTVTPMPNGEMLITGGRPATPELRATTGSIRQLTGATNSLWANGIYPFIATAPNGNAQYLGPFNSLGQISTSGSGTWTSQGSRDGKYRSYGSFAVYQPGKALIAGGSTFDATAVTVDMNSGTTTATGSMNRQRRQHNLTILADGSVLATGGIQNSSQGLVDLNNPVFEAERWNPTTGTWTLLAPANRVRQYHSSALLLTDGRVITAGGGICGDCDARGYLQRNAEIYSPPYLFDSSGAPAVRPQITSAPSVVSFGRTFGIATPNPADVTKVGLIRLGSATHGVDMEQRYVPLMFTRTPTAVIATAPGNGNVAPPGPYMLTIVNAAGVPSVSRVVTVSTGSPNVAPTVQITAPANGATVAAGTPVTITANANDSDGLITSVEFLNNGVRLGVDQTAPYTWTFTPTSTHSLTARATDDAGSVTTSPTVRVSVAATPTTTSTTTSTTKPTTTSTTTSTTKPTTTTTTPPTTGPSAVYTDALQSGWFDWSWATRNLANSTPALGSRSISFEPDNWSGLSFHNPAVPNSLSSVKFSVHGGTTGNQLVSLFVDVNGTKVLQRSLDLDGAIPAGAWKNYEITLPQPAPAGAAVNIGFQAWTGADQSAVYIDNISTASGTAGPTTTTTRPATTTTRLATTTTRLPTTTLAPTTLAPTTTRLATTTTRVATTTTRPPTTTLVPTTVAPTTFVTSTLVPTTIGQTTTTTRLPTTTTTVPPTAAITISAPAATTWGTNFTIVVTGLVPGGYGEITGDGITLGWVTADASGRATFTASLWQVGTSTLRVESKSPGVTGSASRTIVVNPRP